MEQLTRCEKPSGPPGIPPKGSLMTEIYSNVLQKTIANDDSGDVDLFSSSLPVLSHLRSSLTDSGDDSLDDVSAKMKGLNIELDLYDFKVDDTMQHIEDILPNEEEFLKDIMYDCEHLKVRNQAEELEEFDVFGITGGMELDIGPTEGIAKNTANGCMDEGFKRDCINHYGNQYGLTRSVGTVTGEHPHGEHPSRTLFVRNIHSNVDDSVLHSLFAEHGEIRSLYTATKHRGFVMISYYDIRSARKAMHALQNYLLGRKKLDIHFSIPKDNPSDKDLNQGTLVIFNLEPSVSNDELRQIFGVYGEVKEIRETPNKINQRFIEFYDTRRADDALKALNKSEIGGKRIKLEHSRPGGARRNLMNQLSYGVDQEEVWFYRPHVGSPMTSSPPGSWLQFGSPMDRNGMQTSGRGLSSVCLPIANMSNPSRIGPVRKELNHASPADYPFSRVSSSFGGVFPQSHSLSDYGSEFLSSSTGTLPSIGPSTLSCSAVGILTGSQFPWPSPKPYGALPSASMSNLILSNNHKPGQGLSLGSSQSLFGSSGHPHLHAVGSAPSGVPCKSHFGFQPESPETSFMNRFNYDNLGARQSGADVLMNLIGTPASLSLASTRNGIMPDISSHFSTVPSPRTGQCFIGSAPYQGPGISSECLSEQLCSRRDEHVVSQMEETMKQYQLDLEKIIRGEDARTTLMIKNIPNKYKSEQLLATVDINHRGKYDFFYLPIDFKNGCNIGYAFINILSPSLIIPFYEEFNGKRWENFNSEKVASLAYARIQGREALVLHFKNSSLQNQDERYRPVIFPSEGPNSGSEEPFPKNALNAGHSPEDRPSIAMESAESSLLGAGYNGL